jgi:hypothetical protein
MVQVLRLVAQARAPTSEMVGFDLMEMWDAPIRFQQALEFSVVTLALLMVSVFFRRIRFRWVEIPARILTGIIMVICAMQAKYVFQHGIGWPNDSTKTGNPHWVFSRPADLCFLVAWFSLIVLAIILVNSFARKLLPNPRVHPPGA